MSFLQIYYHIVFSTKDRSPAVKSEKRRQVYNYMYVVLQNKQSHVYRIGSAFNGSMECFYVACRKQQFGFVHIVQALLQR